MFSETQLTCSVGVAPNKTLAKVSSDINKPNGQYIVPPSREAVLAFIDTLPTRKVRGNEGTREPCAGMMDYKSRGSGVAHIKVVGCVPLVRYSLSTTWQGNGRRNALGCLALVSHPPCRHGGPFISSPMHIVHPLCSLSYILQDLEKPMS